MVIIINISSFCTLVWCSDVIKSYQNVWGLVLPFTGYCALLTDGFSCSLLCQWSHLEQLWYLGPFTPSYYMTPGCTFKTALAALYLVHTMQNVFLYNMREISVSGLVTSCQSSTLLLSWPAFQVFCSSPPALMEASRAKWKVSCRSQEPQCYICVRFGSASEEGCMGFFRRFWASCFFPTFPWIHRCFRRSMSLTKVWSQTRWLILCMKTQYLWQLNSTSKIKRIPLFQQLSWLFAYLNAWLVLGIVI